MQTARTSGEIGRHRGESGARARLGAAAVLLLLALLALPLGGRVAHLVAFPFAAIAPVVLIADYRRVARRRRLELGEVPSRFDVNVARVVIVGSMVVGTAHAYFFAETFG